MENEERAPYFDYIEKLTSIIDFDLIKNGKVVAVRSPSNDRIKFVYKDEDLKKGEEAYYYVRVTQFDGERG